MAFLSFIYRHAYWVAPAAFALSVSLLVQCIAGVIRTGRQARLFAVPLAASQEIELPEAGEVVLAMEGPILSRRFAGLRYALTGPGGADVSQRSCLFRATTSGGTRATMELKVFHVMTPGRHLFRIEGLGGARPSDAAHRMVFTRPHLGTSMAYVVGIVLSSCLTVSSVVLLALRAAGVAGSE